jgi:DNA helicase-2/ATP-dependent DNA helicase PcrA
VTQRAVIQYAREAQLDLIEACGAAGTRSDDAYPYTASPAARESLTLFGEELAAVRREHAAGVLVAKTVIGTLTIAGGPVDCYDELLRSTDDADVAADCARVKEDLRSLCRAAHSYDQRHGHDGSLVGFLEETRVEPAGVLTSEEDTRLTISTIHGAKGTEAQVVFVIGCEERLLPIGYAIDSSDPARIEEERRLFYVAATRAKDHLTFTAAAERIDALTRGPSRFLTEGLEIG